VQTTGKLEAETAANVFQSTSDTTTDLPPSRLQEIILASYVLCAAKGNDIYGINNVCDLPNLPRSDPAQIPSLPKLIVLLKRLVACAKLDTTAFDDQTKPYETPIAVSYGLGSVAISAVLRVIGTHHVKPMSQQPETLVELTKQIALELANLWERHKEHSAASSLYLHLDEPWFVGSLVPQPLYLTFH